jgi:hypothetical protein
MRDARCLLGFHRWVGVRRLHDAPRADARIDLLGNVWTDGGIARPGLDPDHVVWCKRCGKDRSDASWWMTGWG